MIAEIAKQIIDSKQKLEDLANHISALEASSQQKVNPSPSPTSYVEQTPVPTQSKSNLYQSSVPENFKPSFEFNNYKNKPFEEMINDYIIYHNQMTSGLIPPRYLFLEIGSNVGTGNFSQFFPTFFSFFSHVFSFLSPSFLLIFKKISIPLPFFVLTFFSLLYRRLR